MVKRVVGLTLVILLVATSGFCGWYFGRQPLVAEAAYLKSNLKGLKEQISTSELIVDSLREENQELKSNYDKLYGAAQAYIGSQQRQQYAPQFIYCTSNQLNSFTYTNCY